ncbi:zinc finger protein 135-like [Ochlerotatus camptorhynchus]|uniref:zinc finger protein 135-like n=1 Tax=Ochlerotatus camptorhynchus TaxID=644619 RepID=UPI0031DDAA62
MTSKECRICLRYEQNCVSLFAKRRGTKLAEIVRFCARVEISEDDELPGDACGRCADEALNAYLFVNKCRRSDAELRTAQANFKEEYEEDETVDPGDNGPPEVRDAVEDDPQIESVAEEEEDIPREHSPTESDSMHDQQVVERTEATETEAAETASSFQESVQYEISELDEEMDLIELRDQLHQKPSDDKLEVDVPSAQVKQECFDEHCEENEDDNREDQYLVEYLDDNFRDDFSDAIEETEFVHDETEKESLQGSLMVDGVKHVICCGIRCRAVFNSIQELTEHSTEVHLPLREPESKEKSYECHRCYARFSSEKSLTMHTRKLQHCTICMQIFFSLKEKRLHMHQVHGELAPAAEKQSSQRICCGCHEEFESVKDLRNHSEEVHSIRKGATDETRPFQCDICYKLFRTFESLRIHQRFVYRPKNFVCKVCVRAFDTRSKLLTHQLVHSNKRNFRCDKCDKSFKKDIDLKSHLLLHEEKREICSVCGLKFHRKSNLKMHMRKHQNTFFYACSECPKKFKNNSHLKEHFKVHSKQKPYPCSFCKRSFGYCSDRKRHEMTHTGNYPFECSCSKKFARKTTYEKHVAHCQEGPVRDDPI